MLLVEGGAWSSVLECYPLGVCSADVVHVVFFQAEDGIRDLTVTGVQTCALPISNFCDIGLTLAPDGRRLVLVSCLDNLLKGAAGQAVQNLNLMLGWDEREGLN